jgi:hypothetical protein
VPANFARYFVSAERTAGLTGAGLTAVSGADSKKKATLVHAFSVNLSFARQKLAWSLHHGNAGPQGHKSRRCICHGNVDQRKFSENPTMMIKDLETSADLTRVELSRVRGGMKWARGTENKDVVDARGVDVSGGLYDVGGFSIAFDDNGHFSGVVF